MTSNGHKLTVVSLSKDGGQSHGQDQVFSLPMTSMGAMPWGHQIDLSDLVSADDATIREGFWIQATASRLDHLDASLYPEPVLDSFSVSYVSERG